jgi:hypothetical protein
MNTIKINYNYDTDQTGIELNKQLLTIEEVTQGANMNDIEVSD